MQALYRWQLNAAPWQDLINEFSTDADMGRADGEYFKALVQRAVEQSTELDVALAPFLARKAEVLDPIEHAVLLALRACPGCLKSQYSRIYTLCPHG